MAIINQVVSGGGTTPTGTKNITTNGTHDVAAYEYADVQVPTTAPARYLAFNIDSSGWLQHSTTAPVMDFTGATRVSDYILYAAYKNNNNLVGTLDLSSIEEVYAYSLYQCFRNCWYITSVDLSSLKIIYGVYGLCQAFNGCGNLTSIDLRSLKKIEGQCGAQEMCGGCSSLEYVKFQSLTTIGSMGLYTGFYNTAMKHIYFYALTPSGLTQTNCFTNMIAGVTGCTVHFPIAVQTKIGSWSSVTGGFGGTNTTVLFDIVTSLTGADTNTYTRQEKDSTSTATAWVCNNVLYYTSGVSDQTNGMNEPQVGDTIYSDTACTTAVTTISAIA